MTFSNVFSAQNFFYFYENSAGDWLQWCCLQYGVIGLDNGLVRNRQRCYIQTNDGQAHCCIFASLQGHAVRWSWSLICWQHCNVWSHPLHYLVHPPTPPWLPIGHSHGCEWSTHIPFVPCQSAPFPHSSHKAVSNFHFKLQSQGHGCG